MNQMRRLKREVAKANMKKIGLRKVCHKGNKFADSWFSSNWRDYIALKRK